jgi:hypothetical protein
VLLQLPHASAGSVGSSTGEFHASDSPFSFIRIPASTDPTHADARLSKPPYRSHAQSTVVVRLLGFVFPAGCATPLAAAAVVVIVVVVVISRAGHAPLTMLRPIAHLTTDPFTGTTNSTLPKWQAVDDAVLVSLLLLVPLVAVAIGVGLLLPIPTHWTLTF